MTYAVNKVGTKDEVIEVIEAQVRPNHPDAAAALIELVRAMKGQRVQLNASGFDFGAMLSATSWPADGNA